MPQARVTGLRRLLTVPLLLSSCAPALTTLDQPYATPSPRTILRIYAGSQQVELHGVQWTADSVSGVPYFRPLACGTCRIALARPTIDSAKRVSGREGLGMLAAALPFAALAITAAALSGMGD